MGERSYVIEQIQKLHKEDRALNISAVKRHSPELMEIAYSQNEYWGWKQAVEDAGISYNDIRVDLLDYVVCEICNEPFSSLMSHLNHKHGITKDEYARDYGSHVEVLSEELRANRMNRCSKKANSELPHWEPLYTKEYLLDRLWAYHKMGKTLHARAVQKYDYALLTGSRKYCGGWHPALEAVGLNSSNIRKIDHVHWSRELIIEKLRERKLEKKQLNPKHLRLDDENLYLAIRRVFDNNYDAALRAARINPDKIRLNCRRYT